MKRAERNPKKRARGEGKEKPQVFSSAADEVPKLVGKCAARILHACGQAPKLAVVLGSGFQTLASEVEAEGEIQFADLPGFPVLGVPGHGGRLLWGRLGPLRAFFCLGRAHYYEGHSMDSVTWPVRVLAACGVKDLVLTNAAGGINPAFRVGEFMLFSDHINFIGANPLRGAGDNRRFLDLNETYSARLNASLVRAGERANIPVHQGVYLGVSGPTYETPAEIRAFRTLGADAVGMSTIPEAIMGRYCGMEVAALSCITNAAAGLGSEVLSHQHVLEAAGGSAGKAGDLFHEFALEHGGGSGGSGRPPGETI